MEKRGLVSNLGLYAYATGAIFLGLVGLASGDFATTWQRVGPNVPFREPLAYFTALIEVAAGLALLWRRTARASALLLTALYCVFTLLWVPKIFENLRNFDPIGNFFEEFSIMAAGAVLYAVFSPTESPISRRESLFARLYALSAISFGIGHIYYMPGLLSWIPKWIPPSQMFWAYATTIGFFLAAAAILSGIMAPLASRLITAEIVGFEILVWIPRLLANPHDHFNWAGNAICVALAGAPWVVSDSICRTAKRVAAPQSEMIATREKRAAGAPFYGAFVLTFLSGSAFLGVPPQLTPQRSGPQSTAAVESVTNADLYGNPCDSMMGTMKGMSVMGESMEAMTNHMCITPARPKPPDDEARAKAVVDQVRATMKKYEDYKKAIADGYVQANPTVDQPQFHFTNDANAKYADTVFDPTRPTSLLYYRAAKKRFTLEGVMFTTRPNASEDELNRRIPLSMVRWHKHTNFCGAPASKVNEYFGEHPKFGMFGSIHTRTACVVEGGTFFPRGFTWMIHVFPYESDFKEQFSMNDDISHVH